jgi:hypothetical protein
MCSAMPVEPSGPQNGRLQVQEQLALESCGDLRAHAQRARGASWATTERPVRVTDSATVARSNGTQRAQLDDLEVPSPGVGDPFGLQGQPTSPP